MKPTKHKVTSQTLAEPLNRHPGADDSKRWLGRWIGDEPAVHWALVLASLVVVGWIRMLPLSLGGTTEYAKRIVLVRHARQMAAALPAGTAPAQGERLVAAELRQWVKTNAAQFQAERDATGAKLRSELTYVGKDGVRHVFLGGYDSYHWLRMARNYLRTGTTCDTIRDGRCIDTHANAPVGRVNIYARSLHITAIVAVERLMTFLRPGYPLASSSFLVPVIIGLLGVFPAFAIGRRLAGNLGGLSAAIIIGINPLFLKRSLSSDNDVWNIVLPLLVAWAAIEAIIAERPRRQIACAIAAGIFVGLHAATWSGWPMAYGVVLFAMAANLGMESVRAVIDRYMNRASGLIRLRRAATVIAVFYVAAAACVAIAGGKSYFAVPSTLLRQAFSPHHSGAAKALNLFPNVFSTVAELKTYNLTGIANFMSGQVPFFASWLGLLLLLVPRRGWQMRHYAILLVGNYIYWYLLTGNPGRFMLLALLTLPIAAALVVDLVSAEPAADLGAGLIIGIWFLASLFLSYQGLRFVMLLAAPFGIAFGVAMGRLYQWLAGQLHRLNRPRAEQAVRPVVFAALASVLILPARAGYETTFNYVPPINSGWWKTFDDVRRQSPPDSIVTTWWDYGYWSEYAAERRTTADGGSLATHIPYWIARVLTAPTDRQSAGLLRMLDCGSDSTPLPEGREGAWGKLAAYGAGPIRDAAIISRLTQLDRADADAYLATQKFDPAERADILRSTHCAAPPAYLIVNSKLATLSGWWPMANRDFTREYIFRLDRPLPEAKAVADMVARFGYTPDKARELYKEANAVRTLMEKIRFLAPTLNDLNSRWFQCHTTPDSSLVCDANLQVGKKYVVRQVIYRPDAPNQSLLVVSKVGHDSARLELTPELMVVAGQKRLHDVSFPSTEWPGLGVLIDLPNSRARLGSPGLLQSTFARLFFLNGRYDTIFTNASRHDGFADERISAWKVNWQKLEKGN